MSIKKAFVDIVEFLQANEDKKVKTILADVVAMASAKAGGGGRATTFHKNADGVVVAIKCFYHGLWVSPEMVEFGAKASSPTGLSTMCKVGTSRWTKQQRDAKKAKEELLNSVASGEVEASELTDRLAEIEETRQAVLPLTLVGEDDVEFDYGFASLEDCLADNEARGLTH
ncbi:MAG: hypothetical protein ACR2PH_17890 [Desulfobulbia bacterium]